MLANNSFSQPTSQPYSRSEIRSDVTYSGRSLIFLLISCSCYPFHCNLSLSHVIIPPSFRDIPRSSFAFVGVQVDSKNLSSILYTPCYQDRFRHAGRGFALQQRFRYTLCLSPNPRLWGLLILFTSPVGSSCIHSAWLQTFP